MRAHQVHTSEITSSAEAAAPRIVRRVFHAVHRRRYRRQTAAPSTLPASAASSWTFIGTLIAIAAEGADEVQRGTQPPQQGVGLVDGERAVTASAAHSSAAPLNASPNAGLRMAEFIACIAAMPSGAGRRPRAGITLVEKANMIPATRADATAAATAPTVIGQRSLDVSGERGERGARSVTAKS